MCVCVYVYIWSYVDFYVIPCVSVFLARLSCLKTSKLTSEKRHLVHADFDGRENFLTVPMFTFGPVLNCMLFHVFLCFCVPGQFVLSEDL